MGWTLKNLKRGFCICCFSWSKSTIIISFRFVLLLTSGSGSIGRKLEDSYQFDSLLVSLPSMSTHRVTCCRRLKWREGRCQQAADEIRHLLSSLQRLSTAPVSLLWLRWAKNAAAAFIDRFGIRFRSDYLCCVISLCRASQRGGYSNSL